MPIFNPKLFDKKNRNKRLNKNIYTYEVLEKTVIGVCGITIEGNYFVVTEKGTYKFSDDSYTIRTDKPFYSQQIIDGKRLQVTELHKQIVRGNDKTYLPFAPGVCCIGSVVINKTLNIKVFKLKNTFIDKTSKVANDMWQYYKNNYEQIRKNIKQ